MGKPCEDECHHRACREHRKANAAPVERGAERDGGRAKFNRGELRKLGKRSTAGRGRVRRQGRQPHPLAWSRAEYAARRELLRALRRAQRKAGEHHAA